MYRAVGQVVHLLQDTSQPQHARNEQHVNPFTNWAAKLDPWASPIEAYGFRNLLQLNYQHAMLDWKGAGFTKLEDFWDRHMYHGNNPAVLNADNNGGTNTLGLAEWCNGNFLGARHLYAEYYPTNDIRYFPYPSRNTSTDYLETKSHLSAAAQPFAFKNGQTAQAIYLKKTGDGTNMDYHSRFTYFGAKNPNFGMITINDDNVLSNYHAVFIPKAVKYSAGLIDYYFRGNLGLNPGYVTNGAYSLQITNTSGQDFNGGAFRLFYDDTNGTRTELTGTNFTTNYSGALAAGGVVNATFINQANAKQYVLMYQGTIGSSGGTALDPVDDGIAIAAGKFTNPFWHLTWVTNTVITNGGFTLSTTLEPSSFTVDTASLSLSGGVVLEVTGTQTYTGPSVLANLQLNATDGGTESGSDNAMFLTVSQDGTSVLSKTIYTAGPTNYVFSIGSGSNSTLSVQLLQISDGGLNLNVTGTLSAVQ
jgi:hypothetical protein